MQAITGFKDRDQVTDMLMKGAARSPANKKNTQGASSSFQERTFRDADWQAKQAYERRGVINMNKTRSSSKKVSTI